MRSQFEALEEGLGRQIAGRGAFGSRPKQLRGVEVTKVDAPDDRAERGVRRDVREELVEDAAMGDGDPAVQRFQGGKVQGPGCQQERHQVDVSSSESIGRDVEDETIDDGGYILVSNATTIAFGFRRRLTENLEWKPLKGSLARRVWAVLVDDNGGRGWRAPRLIQNLQIAKALAGELALDLNILPSAERVGWSPVAQELAGGLGNRRLELRLRLDHVDIAGPESRRVASAVLR